MIEQVRNRARQNGGVKLHPVLRCFNAASEEMRPFELRSAVQAIVERVSYQRSNSEVLVQLHSEAEDRHA